MAKKKSNYVWDDIDHETEVKEKKTKKSLYDTFATYEDEEKIEKKPISPQKTQVKKTYKRTISVKKIFLISFFIIIVFLFIPIFKVKEIKVTELNISKSTDIIEASEFKVDRYYNYFTFLTSGRKIKVDQISKIEIRYSIRKQLLTIDAQELKPLALKTDKTLLYMLDNKIQSSKSLVYDVPKLLDFKEDTQAILLDNLSKLSYNVIKEIAVIQYQNKDDSNGLVIMEMKDGNYVKINMSQISEKLPYYNQMKQVINASNNGKQGIIHLDRGDYYEPL